MAEQTKKIYAYVDETGGDTKGRMFLVSVVVMTNNRDQLRGIVRNLELVSGRKEKKWGDSNRKQRVKYIEGLLEKDYFQKTIFCSYYEDTKAYADLTVITTAKALHEQGSGRATVFIDGLPKSQRDAYAKNLRKLNVQVRKVRGLRDQSDEFIRLADAIAGFVREYIQGSTWTKVYYRKAVKHKIIEMLS